MCSRHQSISTSAKEDEKMNILWPFLPGVWSKLGLSDSEFGAHSSSTFRTRSWSSIRPRSLPAAWAILFPATRFPTMTDAGPTPTTRQNSPKEIKWNKVGGKNKTGRPDLKIIKAVWDHLDTETNKRQHREKSFECPSRTIPENYFKNK